MWRSAIETLLITTINTLIYNFNRHFVGISGRRVDQGGTLRKLGLGLYSVWRGTTHPNSALMKQKEFLKRGTQKTKLLFRGRAIIAP